MSILMKVEVVAAWMGGGEIFLVMCPHVIHVTIYPISDTQPDTRRL